MVYVKRDNMIYDIYELHEDKIKLIFEDDGSLLE